MPRPLAFLLLAVASLSPAPAAKVTVGEPVPAFSVTTMDGKRIGPAELRGKRVLYFMCLLVNLPRAAAGLAVFLR